MHYKNALVSDIAALFADYGDKHYGEACSQTIHALSCAHHAIEKKHSSTMILAALLHDIGHFIADREQLPGFDHFGYADHAELAAHFLSEHQVPEQICEPIRLHVSAKRYLAAQHDRPLSNASATTLSQQGGAMNPAECLSFEQENYFEQALQLRELDELGKPERWRGGNLQHHLQNLDRLLSFQNKALT